MTATNAAIIEDPTTGRIYEVSLETINPELAKAYLDTSPGNRKLHSQIIRARYIPDMLEGRWRVNGETVIFDEYGQLRAGHHRLTAAVEGDAEFTTFVVRGVEGETARTTDSGLAKTVSDHLGADGETNATQIAAIVRTWLTFQREGRFVGGGQNAVSNEAVYEALAGPDATKLREAAERLRSFRGKHMPFHVRGGILGVLWILFRDRNPDQADEFFYELRHGYGLEPGDPVLALRERLMNAKNARETIPDYSYAYMVITAWNAARTGRRLLRSSLPKNTDGAWPAVL